MFNLPPFRIPKPSLRGTQHKFSPDVEGFNFNPRTQRLRRQPSSIPMTTRFIPIKLTEEEPSYGRKAGARADAEGCWKRRGGALLNGPAKRASSDDDRRNQAFREKKWCFVPVPLYEHHYPLRVIPRRVERSSVGVIFAKAKDLLHLNLLIIVELSRIRSISSHLIITRHGTFRHAGRKDTGSIIA